MSTGKGYRVEVDSLRAFAAQVRGLLDEFQSRADGTRTHGQTGVANTAFGSFAEANALREQYERTRDGLRDVLNMLQDAVDEAQRKADLTAANYEDQEAETSRHLKVNSDGWSVEGGVTAAPVSYGSGRRPATVPTPKAPSPTVSPTVGGESQGTW
ncbi:hypothetical protein ACIRBX_30810 [Kitasatospora sp. NPDC096147]|uniref:hypothetical protein n=1 Tax=Kitasatospora sp. NPDC096147 TaxID=3364093 RepID=UPI0038142EA9